MIPASITLNSASKRLTAQLGGTYLKCLFRQPAGQAIPPGNYTISPPMHNSVYGTFALLSPARVASLWAMGWIEIDGPVEQGHKDWISPRASAGWIEMPFAGNKPGVFVLVEHPLAGRSIILITEGFAELMGALHQAGGATVTVA